MKDSIKNINKFGVMGGTFDPIHVGHLNTAEAALKKFNLDVVCFVPAGRPPHKTNEKITPAEHRFMMTRLATNNDDSLCVSRMEINREGLSYTIDTVQEFRKILGNNAEIYFIAGADTIMKVETWHRIEELIGSCEFVAATRPGYTLNKIMMSSDWLQSFRENLHILRVPNIRISSTEIRKKVGQDKSIKNLVPAVVENYIYKNGLYT